MTNKKIFAIAALVFFALVCINYASALAEYNFDDYYHNDGYPADDLSYDFDFNSPDGIPSLFPSYSYDNYFYNGFNPVYEYYGNGYHMPEVYGPFPRQYVLYNDFFNGNNKLIIDDFHGYDSFQGYKDLDIYYPDGTIEVIRNPYATELPAIDNPEGYGTFGSHVYGYIPGPDGTCLMYKKHYGDDHEWGMPDYNYGYGYYTPFTEYQNTPVYTNPCQSTGMCQYRYSAAY